MLDNYIDSLLKQWADWRARRMDGGMGFPSKSAFLSIAGGGSTWISEVDSQCYEIDQAVCSLITEQKEVVMRRYTETGTIEQKANRCGCSIRTYDARLAIAANSVKGYSEMLRKNKYSKVQTSGIKLSA